MNAFEAIDSLISCARPGSCLPPQWRSRFLESVVDHLIGEVGAYDAIGGCQVQHAVERTLRRIGIVT
jgi:hypothetical protein